MKTGTVAAVMSPSGQRNTAGARAGEEALLSAGAAGDRGKRDTRNGEGIGKGYERDGAGQGAAHAT
jgi:hypothetical protein